jgi:hypothetical protein
MHPGRLYIFTLPKAGTYFLAGLMGWFGWHDSGWHLEERLVLETHEADLATNARNPLAVRREQLHTVTLDRLPAGHLCFGHMNPMLFQQPHGSDVAVLACRRRPRDVLVSEFIDSRFRREDDRVEFVSRRRIADDREAFAVYLRDHGAVIADICATMVAYRALRGTGYWTRTRRLAPYVEVAFDELMGPDPLPALRRLADSCGVRAGDDRLLQVLQAAKRAENKTKTVGMELPFARNELWTADAEAGWRRHGFAELSTLLGYPEL